MSLAGLLIITHVSPLLSTKTLTIILRDFYTTLTLIESDDYGIQTGTGKLAIKQA